MNTYAIFLEAALIDFYKLIFKDVRKFVVAAIH